MDVVICVIVIGHEGKNHLQIPNKNATGKVALQSTNHTLLLFQQLFFFFDGIVFEMVMQMLEVRAMRTP